MTHLLMRWTLCDGNLLSPQLFVMALFAVNIMAMNCSSPQSPLLISTYKQNPLHFLDDVYSDRSKTNSSDLPVNSSSAFITGLIRHLVSLCCQQETEVLLHKEYAHARELEESISDEAFALPITRSQVQLGAAQVGTLFIPLVESPGAFFVVSNQHSDSALLKTLAAAWPLMVIIVMTSAVSGMIIWVLDRWHTPSDFPRTFLRGVWDGIWWAIVSMTTVGYGDRKPRSAAGRVYAMLWILAGIVIISVFTATLTTSFTEETSTAKEIRGLKIGVVVGSREEHLAVLYGADVITYPGLDLAIRDLDEDGELEGLLVDSFLALHRSQQIKARNAYVQTFFSEPATHGILLKGLPENTLHCMADMAGRQRYVIMDQVKQKSQPLEGRRGKAGAQTMTTVMQPSLVPLYVTLAVLILLTAILISWDCLTNCRHPPEVNQESNEQVAPPSSVNGPPKRLSKGRLWGLTEYWRH